MGLNSLLRILLIIIFFFPVAAFTQVQNGNKIVVERSKEKTIINGKTYYLHTVKKGENVYRISLAYGVTQKDVILANPEILSGVVVKEGQILKIPTESSSPRNIQQIESDKFIFHIAEEGQTIYSITQQYKITKEELYKYNPELELSTLQIGQVVRIPKSQNLSVEPEKVQTIENFIEHKVKRKETKYSISKQYDITVDELIASNPILNTEDLQPGQILKIPVKNKADVVTVTVIGKSDTIGVINQLKTVPCDSAYTRFSETYNVAMLFPLCIEENQLLAMIDSANSIRESEKQNVENDEVYQLSKNILEFYQGALLALDTLKKAGISLRLYTYDTGRDTQKIDQILNQPELAKMDLIIGPFFTKAVEKVAQFALKNRIKLVSPVSANSNVLKNNPFVFQVIPNDTVNADVMLNYISSLPNKNIVLICSNNPRDKGIIDLYRKKLFISSSNNYKEYFFKEYNIDQLNSYLVENVDNIMIIPSEDQNFIGDIFSLLNVAAKTYSVKIFGLPVCNMFDNVREYFHSLEFHYYTSFYADYANASVKNFLAQYKMYYNTEPYYHNINSYPYYFTKEGFNYAFSGYDITFYFLSSMSRLGKNFENCIGTQKFNLLHANFDFERLNPGSGFMNKNVNILKYTKDYYITKVN